MGRSEPPTFENALSTETHAVISDPPPPYVPTPSAIPAPGPGPGPGPASASASVPRYLPGSAPFQPSGDATPLDTKPLPPKPLPAKPLPRKPLPGLPSPPQSRLRNLVRGHHNNNNTSTPAPQIPKPRTLAQVFALYPWRRSWGPVPKDLPTALYQASLLGIAHLVTALLDAGAVVSSNEHLATQEPTAVHAALRGPRPDLALLLLHRGLGSELNGNPTAVTSVLASRDTDACTPLHVAAGAGEADLVCRFVGLGAAVDAVDNHKRTPLHMAARYGRREALCCLLDLGADPARVHRGLWDAAGAMTTPELGSYALVSEALRVALEATQDSGMASPGGMLEEGTSAPSMPAGDDEPGARPRQLSIIESPTLPDHRPMRSYRQSARADMAAAAFASMYDARLATPRRAPVAGRDFAPTSFRDTPEYESWSRACEKVYAEHLAQQKKNLSLDNGGMGFVPPEW